jgi:hypothetical protein
VHLCATRRFGSAIRVRRAKMLSNNGKSRVIRGRWSRQTLDWQPGASAHVLTRSYGLLVR